MKFAVVAPQPGQLKAAILAQLSMGRLTGVAPHRNRATFRLSRQISNNPPLVPPRRHSVAETPVGGNRLCASLGI
jgi:hypothetical protein